MIVRAVLIAGLALSLGCRKEQLRVPEQPEEAGPSRVECPPMLSMKDANVESCFTKDIRALEAGSWRWTGVEPTVVVEAPDAGPWMVAADAHVPDVTLKELGTQTVAVLVNGREVYKETIGKPGGRKLAAAVPADLVRAGRNQISLRIDPTWQNKSDGSRLGVILVSIGLVRP